MGIFDGVGGNVAGNSAATNVRGLEQTSRSTKANAAVDTGVRELHKRNAMNKNVTDKANLTGWGYFSGGLSLNRAGPGSSSFIVP